MALSANWILVQRPIYPKTYRASTNSLLVLKQKPWETLATYCTALAFAAICDVAHASMNP